MKILKVKQKDRATGSRVLHFASRLALGTVSIKCSVLTLCVVCGGNTCSAWSRGFQPVLRGTSELYYRGSLKSENTFEKIL